MVSKYKSRLPYGRSTSCQVLEGRRLLCNYELPPVGSPPNPGGDLAGPLSALVLRVEYANFNGAISDTVLNDQLAWVNAHYLRNSNQQFHFEFTAAPVIQLGNTANYPDIGVMREAAKAKVVDLGQTDPSWVQFNPANYDRILFLNPLFGAAAFLGGKEAWVPNSAIANLSNGTGGTLLHELGHTLGWAHSGSYEPDNSRGYGADYPAVRGGGGTAEYIDPFTFMGEGSRMPGQVSIVQKKAVGWLTDANVPIIASNTASLRIYASDQSAFSSTQVVGARIPIGIGTGHYYWAEYRGERYATQANPDAVPLNSEYTANGIQLRWTEYTDRLTPDFFGGGVDSALIDVNPSHVARVKYANGTAETLPTVADNQYNGSKAPNLLDASITTGQSFSDPWGTVTVTTLGVGIDGGRPYADVKIHFGSSNNVPTNVSMYLPLGNVRANQSVTLSASAVDADGDNLAYLWEIADPEFGWRRVMPLTAQTPSIVTSFAKSGTYQIMVRVSDGTGNTITKTDFVEVIQGITPLSYVRVSGRVVDSAGFGIGNVHIAGIRSDTIPFGDITLLVDSTITDSDGYYSFLRTTGVDNSYRIVAMDADHVIAPIEDSAIPITDSARTRVDFLATQRTSTIAGTLRRTNGPLTPIAGVTMQFGSRSTVTRTDGSYEIELPPGRYVPTASMGGSSLALNLVTVDASTPGEYTADLRTTVQMNGASIALLTPSGAPYPTYQAPQVFVTNSILRGFITNLVVGVTPTNFPANNFFPTGKYYTWIRRSAAESWIASQPDLVNVVAGATPSLAFTAQTSTPRSAIYGRALDANGPITSGTAQLFKNGVAIGAAIPTDDAGYYYFPGPAAVAADQFQIGISASGISTLQSAAFTLPATADFNVPDLFAVNAPSIPSIVQTPLTAYGSVIELAASSVGAGLRYEWESQAVPVAGATVAFNRNKTATSDVVEARFSHAGTYTVRVRATDRYGRSSAWQPVTVQVDEIADHVRPDLRRAGLGYLFEQAFVIQFMEEVTDDAGSFPAVFDSATAVGSVFIINLTTLTMLTPADFRAPQWDAKTHTLTLRPAIDATHFNGVRFADGRYSISFDTRTIRDGAGNVNRGYQSGAFDQDVHTLGGDANHDGTVDFADLVTLAQNYGATRTFFWSGGDFNYDGVVDFNDLVTLAQNYGLTV